MSFAAESWLNVSLNPEGPSRPLLTCFPVTLHDWPVTEPEGECKYCDPRFEQANHLILGKDISYYRAWMQITSTSEDKLPSILGLDKQTCQDLLDNPSSKLKIFPVPPISVLRFCKEVGVHPAYLQCQNSSLDHSLMMAVIELMREKTKCEVKDLFKIESFPEKDRLVAKMLCDREAYFHKCFLENDKISKMYIERALNMVRANNRVNFNKAGLAPGFNYLMGYHQSDILDALRIFEDSLHREVARCDSSVKDINFKAAHIAISLEEYGQVIFGEKNSPFCLDIIARKIEEILATPDLPENIWAYLRDEILNGDVCLDDILEGDGEFIFPSIHPDFEMLAYRYHLDPEECKEDFLDLLEKYIGVRNIHSDESEKLRMAKAAVDKFYNWQRELKTEDHINIFKNGMSVIPYIDKPVTLKTLTARPDVTPVSAKFDLENPYNR